MSAPPVALAAKTRLRSDFLALGLLVLVWAVMAAVIDPLGNFPLNDDWVYGLAVRSILETGRFALPSPSSANLFVQAYWGALFCLPFGFSFTALRISTLVLGGVGPIAQYLLLRDLGARRPAALVGGLTLAANPLYLGLSASFMTDVPFTALATVALWLYVRGVQRGQAAAIGGALALAFVAISIRQFGLVLPLAFGVTHLVRKGVNRRTLAVAVLPFLLAVALQLTYDRWLIATGRTPLVPVPLEHLLPASMLTFAARSALAILVALPYVGFCVAPFFAYRALAGSTHADPVRPRSSWQIQALMLVLLLVGLGASGAMLPALGDVLIPSGLGPLTLRDTWVLEVHKPAIPAIVSIGWILVTAISLWAAIATVLTIANMMAGAFGNLRLSEWRKTAWPQVLMLTVTGAYAGGLILIGGTSSLFDRYFLPLVPSVLAILVIGSEPTRSLRELPWRGVRCFALLGFYAMFAVLATHDYLAWNRARWRATDSLLQSGVTPHQIDGGYEFDGWYLYRPGYQVTEGKSYWWVDDDQYIIASAPLGGYQEIRQFRVNRWLGLTGSRVLILRRIAAGRA